MNMELSANTDGQTEQIEKENDDLFTRFYNDSSLDPTNVEAKAPSNEAAPAPEVDVSSSESKETETEGKSTDAPKAAEQEVVADTPPSQPDPNGWFDKLDPEVRGQVEALAREAQQWKEYHARLASKNRKMNNELENLKKKVEVPKAPSPDETDGDETWAKLKEADPILIGEMEKKLKRLEERFAREAEEKARAVIQPIEQEKHEYFIAEQGNILNTYVPNWQEVMQHPSYSAWIENQSPGVQQLANSLHAKDYIYMLQLYDQDMQRMYGQPQQPTPEAPQQPQTPVDPKVARITEQRQDKLAKSAPVMPAGPGVAKQTALTQEQKFQKFYDDPNSIYELLTKAKGAN